ncbi:hypothetical protein P8C59_002757 [Phyllachora maydis]|uniref:Uncharacterized protein n=1 Tax=Phyllachora maydis TaxID=1825666 RepID=A0AAD9I0F4_9PEZI|nr:hypothetical protein P8C59_002757 [Phyllachora maydis]
MRPSAPLSAALALAGSIPDAAAALPPYQSSATAVFDTVFGLFRSPDVETANLFAQALADGLQCPGVGGLAAIVKHTDLTALEAVVISDDPGTSPTVPGPLTFTRGMHHYEIDPTHQTAVINGVPAPRVLLLIVAHAVLMTFALFGLFPSILLVDSLGVFHRLLALPWPRARAHVWTSVAEGVVHPALLILGVLPALFALGPAAASAPALRSPHAMLGWATVVLALVNCALGPLRRARHPDASTQGLGALWPGARDRPALAANALATNAVMVMSSFVLADGIDAFAQVFLCWYEDVLGNGLVLVNATSWAVAVWYGVVGVMVLETWVTWRLAVKEKKEKRLSDASESVSVGSGDRIGMRDVELGERNPEPERAYKVGERVIPVQAFI